MRIPCRVRPTGQRHRPRGPGRTAKAIPGAGFALLESSGHFLPIERPDEVAASIRQLLDPKSTKN